MKVFSVGFPQNSYICCVLLISEETLCNLLQYSNPVETSSAVFLTSFSYYHIATLICSFFFF